MFHYANAVSQYACALHISQVLTADNDALGGLHLLVISKGAFVFTLSLSADGSQSIVVGIFHQHFLTLVEREEVEEPEKEMCC